MFPRPRSSMLSARVPAHEYGILTFMAKPGRPRIGSSCHIHLGLRRDDRAALAGNSEVFKQYIERERIFGCG
jgi:glutamine synthetase